MRLPIQVVTYPVRRTSGGEWQYLLLKRSVQRGGFWQGASGGEEEGERIHEAAIRELMEETGLAAQLLHKINMIHSFPVEERWRSLYAPGVRTIVEHVFFARVPEQAEPRRSEEHVDFRWCVFQEALSLLDQPERPEFVRAIDKCDSFLRATTIWAEPPDAGDGNASGY